MKPLTDHRVAFKMRHAAKVTILINQGALQRVVIISLLVFVEGILVRRCKLIKTLMLGENIASLTHL